MAPQAKTSFKTYEASTRLLAAVIATSPNIKLDFKALASHMGGGATGAAIDHRLRPLKQLAKLQAACVERGDDPGELPVDKGEIQKLFGESTAGGLEWQFREIKALGRSQKAAYEKGEDPSQLKVGSGTNYTPLTKKGATTTPGSQAKKATPASTTSTAGKGRKRKAPESDEDSDGDDNARTSDYDAMDMETPSKRQTTAKGKATAATPSTAGVKRSAAALFGTKDSPQTIIDDEDDLKMTNHGQYSASKPKAIKKEKDGKPAKVKTEPKQDEAPMGTHDELMDGEV